jgi:hypothetical protein
MPVSHMSINILNMFSLHILLESVGSSVGDSVGWFGVPSGTIWFMQDATRWMILALLPSEEKSRKLIFISTDTM